MMMTRVVPVAAPSPSVHPEPPRDSPRPLVLLVESDARAREACELLLEQEGFSFVSTGAAAEALALLREQTFDVLLCQAQVEGFDAAQVLRFALALPHRPAIALMSQQAPAGSQAWAEGQTVLVKPLDPSELGITLAWLLHERHVLETGVPASDLELLYRIATAANAVAVSPQLLDRLLAITLAGLGGDSASLMTASVGPAQPRTLTLTASCGLDPRRGHKPLEFGASVAGWVAANARPLRLVGPLSAYPQFKALPSNPGRADALIAPLLFRREVLGTISVNSSVPNTFGTEKLALLVSIAEVLAAALHRDRLARTREHHDRLAVMGQLSATVAHELSNPLLVLMASVDALDELLAGEPAPRSESSALLADARDAANRMQVLISELKGAVRKPDSSFQPVDLTAVVNRIALLVQPELKHRAQLTVEPGGPEHVLGDAGRLGQVLVNLIVNASHAVGRGGQITVRTRRDGAWSVVDVDDNGSGIDPSVAPHLFEPFFTTKPEGTGLGLSICQQIAVEHQGTLTFEARAEGGTRFMLRVPSLDAARPRPPTVLLVDDDPLLLRALARVVGTKFEVLQAADATDALALAKSTPPDFVLTDFSMPGHDGLWLAQALRAQGCRAPTALLTAASTSTEIAEAVRSGLIVKVFSKPWNQATLPGELLALMQSVPGPV